MSFFSEPKKDKLENGGELVRPERPNSLSAGKLPRRICYQGDVGMSFIGFYFFNLLHENDTRFVFSTNMIFSLFDEYRNNLNYSLLHRYNMLVHKILIYLICHRYRFYYS